MEEEHRRILRAAVQAPGTINTFKEHLLNIPAGDHDALFTRKRTISRRKLKL